MSQSIPPEQNVSANDGVTERTPLAHSRLSTVVNVVVVAGFLLILVAMLLPSGGHPPEAGYRSRCKNHLKQIGLALHNYHDQYECFPPAFITNENGRPMHSWRVLILPFLLEPKLQELYDQYRFDEPWDGPNNQKLAAAIGDLFQCPSDKVVAPEWRLFTNYVAIIGPQTAWPGARPTTIRDIKDGASNTVLVAEVANSGIHWMEPRDLHVLQMSPAINPGAGQGLSSRHNAAIHTLLADGTVRLLSENQPRETIQGLLTIKGGEKIDDF